MTRVEAFF